MYTRLFYIIWRIVIKHYQEGELEIKKLHDAQGQPEIVFQYQRTEGELTSVHR